MGNANQVSLGELSSQVIKSSAIKLPPLEMFDRRVHLVKDSITFKDVDAALKREGARESVEAASEKISLTLKGREVDLRTPPGYLKNVSKLTIYADKVVCDKSSGTTISLVGTAKDPSPEFVLTTYSIDGKLNVTAQGRAGTAGTNGAAAWVQKKETIVQPGKTFNKPKSQYAGDGGLEDIEPETKVEYIDHAAKDGTPGTAGNPGGSVRIKYVAATAAPTMAAPGGAGGKGGAGGSSANQYGHKLAAGKRGANGAEGQMGTVSSERLEPEELRKALAGNGDWAEYRTQLGLYHFARGSSKDLTTALSEFRAALVLHPDKKSDAARFLGLLLRGLRPNGLNRYADIVVDDLFFRADLTEYLNRLETLVAEAKTLVGLLILGKDLSTQFDAIRAAMKEAAEIESTLLGYEEEACSTEESTLINELKLLKTEADALQDQLETQSEAHKNSESGCLGTVFSVVGLVASTVGSFFSGGATLAGAAASAASLIGSGVASAADTIVSFGSIWDKVDYVVEDTIAVLDDGIESLEDLESLASTVYNGGSEILESASGFANVVKSAVGSNDFSKLNTDALLSKLTAKAPGTRADLNAIQRTIYEEADDYPDDMRQTLKAQATLMIKVARTQGELAAVRIRKAGAHYGTGAYLALANSLAKPLDTQAESYYEDTLAEYIKHARLLLQHIGIFYFLALRSREILNAPGIDDGTRITRSENLASLGYFHPDDEFLEIPEQLDRVKAQVDSARAEMDKWKLSDAFFRANGDVNPANASIRLSAADLSKLLEEKKTDILIAQPEIPTPTAATLLREMRVWSVNAVFSDVTTAGFLDLTHCGPFKVKSRSDGKDVRYELLPRTDAISFEPDSSNISNSVFAGKGVPKDVTEYYSEFPCFRGRGVDANWRIGFNDNLIKDLSDAFKAGRSPQLIITLVCVSE